MSLEDMVVATGIGQSYLEALERDDIGVLPGKAFGKLYIRAYAEVFEFDPQPWIDAYDREQRAASGASTAPTSPVPASARPVAAAIARWKESRAASEKPETAVEDFESVNEVEEPEEVEVILHKPEASFEPSVVASEGVEPVEVRGPAARRRVGPPVLAGIAAIALAVYFGMRGAGRTQPVVRPAPQVRPPEPTASAVVESPPAPPAKPSVVHQPPVVRETPVGALTVPEFAVGRRIVSSRLEGEGSEFAAGEVACFQTRVVGGRRGETVRHVWIYDGRAQQSITLRLGGPDWRTHTNKTLYKTGAWTVEARDGNGRVLATASFACVPAQR